MGNKYTAENVVVKIVTYDENGEKEIILNGYDEAEFKQQLKRLNETTFQLEPVKNENSSS